MGGVTLSICADTPPELINLHGHAVRLQIEHPVVARAAVLHLDALRDDEAPSVNIAGVVVDYVHANVMRHVADDAVRVRPGQPGYHRLHEVFRSPRGDRWWHLDERWGLSQVDLVRGRWRSFVLPRPRLDSVRLFEAAVWWPLAHLLTGRGLHLVPATTTCAGDGCATLFAGGASRDAMSNVADETGLLLVGRRWTAVRTDGRVLEARHMPGLEAKPTSLRTPGNAEPLRAVRPKRPEVAAAPLVRIALTDPLALAAAHGSDRAGRLAALRRVWPMPLLTPAAARLLRRLADEASFIAAAEALRPHTAVARALRRAA